MGKRLREEGEQAEVVEGATDLDGPREVTLL
jgi:hypothetical protein